MTPREKDQREHEVVEAVLYALKVGCLYDIPPIGRGSTVQDCIQWGAMRNLHEQVARLNTERYPR